VTDSEQHPYVEWIAREAKRPVVTDQAVRDRLMAAVRAEPVPHRRNAFWSRIVEPRVFHLSPAGSALLAAGLVGIGVVAGLFSNNRDASVRSGRPEVSAVSQLPVSDTVVKFVYVAPQAEKVSLVGDFNGWDTTKTPMVRVANGGVWTVTLPLSAGRHLYSFVVDGSAWSTDPAAPLAADDGFGHANSVKIVSRGPAL
jgi:predicted carbohydrate-binding protein with CBM48